MIDTIIMFNSKIEIDITKCEDHEVTSINTSKYDILHTNCICNHFNQEHDLHGNRFTLKNDYFRLVVKPRQVFLEPYIHNLLGQDHNLLTVKKNHLIEALRRLEKALVNQGVCFDVYGSQLSRLDLRKNIYLDYPYEEYEPLLKVLHAKKMKKFKHLNSYYFDNSLCQINIYDKSLQLAQVKYNFTSTNIMRIEYRMKKKQKTVRELKYQTVQSMIDNMDNLETFYKEKVGDLLFHYKQSAIGSKIRSPQSEFKWFMNESDAKYKMNEYLMTKGVEKVMEEVGDISVFSKELSQNAIDSSYQHIKKFQGRLLNSQFSKEYGPTVGEIYNEIHSKFYGPNEDYIDEVNNIYASELAFPLDAC